jgi:hypothetical protein
VRGHTIAGEAKVAATHLGAAAAVNGCVANRCRGCASSLLLGCKKVAQEVISLRLLSAREALKTAVVDVLDAI